MISLPDLRTRWNGTRLETTCDFRKSSPVPRRLQNLAARARSEDERPAYLGKRASRSFLALRSTTETVVFHSGQLVRAESSILFQSSALSWSFGAAMFSSRSSSDDVPGIGNITGDLC